MTQNTSSPAWGGYDSRLIAGFLAILTIILTFSAINAWSMSQPATRQEVARSIIDLDPACRPIVGIRLRSRLVQTGRPLTRREMNAVVSDVSACPAINDQLAGLDEAK